MEAISVLCFISTIFGDPRSGQDLGLTTGAYRFWTSHFVSIQVYVKPYQTIGFTLRCAFCPSSLSSFLQALRFCSNHSFLCDVVIDSKYLPSSRCRCCLRFSPSRETAPRGWCLQSSPGASLACRSTALRTRNRPVPALSHTWHRQLNQECPKNLPFQA